jgi:hypothetical protein
LCISILSKIDDGYTPPLLTPPEGRRVGGGDPVDSPFTILGEEAENKDKLVINAFFDLTDPVGEPITPFPMGMVLLGIVIFKGA